MEHFLSLSGALSQPVGRQEGPLGAQNAPLGAQTKKKTHKNKKMRSQSGKNQGGVGQGGVCSLPTRVSLSHEGTPIDTVQAFIRNAWERFVRGGKKGPALVQGGAGGR